jgi:hypothetical protein
MYQFVSQRLQQPLHITSDAKDAPPEQYGNDQPGFAIQLVRDRKDLYRFASEAAALAAGKPQAVIGGPRSSSKKPPGIPKPMLSSHRDAWERRFSELKAFVDLHGYRPRRAGDDVDDTERKLHFWMGQNQRKLNKNELPPDQADRLASVLQVKGPKTAPRSSKKGSQSDAGGGGAAAGSASEGGLHSATEGEAMEKQQQQQSAEPEEQSRQQQPYSAEPDSQQPQAGAMVPQAMDAAAAAAPMEAPDEEMPDAPPA